MVTSTNILVWVQIIKKFTILFLILEHFAENNAVTEYTLGILKMFGVLIGTLIFVNNPYLRMHL